MSKSELVTSSKKYDIIYIDPPWSYFGSETKDAAAAKHYNLMEQKEIERLPIKNLLNKHGACFLWATGPRLDFAFSAIESWNLHYRGVAHVWVKTRKDGNIIYGQGVPPTYSKPTTEFLLLATTNKTGRPHKLLCSKLPQVVLAPREQHSAKPEIFRSLIEKAYNNGNARMLEAFARKKVKNWDAIGNEVTGEDVFESIEKIQKGTFFLP